MVGRSGRERRQRRGEGGEPEGDDGGSDPAPSPEPPAEEPSEEPPAEEPSEEPPAEEPAAEEPEAPSVDAPAVKPTTNVSAGKGLAAAQGYLALMEEKLRLTRVQATQLLQTLPAGSARADTYLVLRGARPSFAPCATRPLISYG